MKTKQHIQGLLVLIWICAFSVPLWGGNVEFDRDHWRTSKEGLRYGKGGASEDFNQNWQDKFNQKENRKDGRGGFGKYSKGENRGSSGGKNNNGNTGSGGGNESEDNYEIDIEPPAFESPSWSGMSGLGYFFLILGIIALVVVLFFLLRNVNLKRNTKTIAPEEEQEEQEAIEIPKSELELLLEAALQKGDYREAIRIWFIFLIKELRHKNWIAWERKKTNVHYLREMSERRQYDAFSTTVRYFELVWYGKRQLSQEEYRALEPLFSQLLKEVEKA
jgi:uncharacterized membrane protein